MDPNPKSAKYKIAFTGTNCSGKTTMALEVTSRLKSEYHYLAEVVSSQDRKITWKDDHFPVDPRAHYGMITNMIHAEVQAELKGDAMAVITDRSVLDLYAIALTDHPDSQMIRDLGVAVTAWTRTYAKILYLPPLPYQEDGKRPADDFRMRTHAKLLDLIHTGDYPNIEMVTDRSTVMSRVRDTLGIKSKNPAILAETAKWQNLTNNLMCTVVVKNSTWASSDRDAWVLVDTPAYQTLVTGRQMVSVIFGEETPIHLMTLPTQALQELLSVHPATVYYPQEV